MAFSQSAFVTIAEAGKKKKKKAVGGRHAGALLSATPYSKKVRHDSNTNLSHLEMSGNHSTKLWNVS